MPNKAKARMDAAVRNNRANLEAERHRLARWAREKPVVPSWLWNRLRELRNDFETAVEAAARAEVQRTLPEDVEAEIYLDGAAPLAILPLDEARDKMHAELNAWRAGHRYSDSPRDAIDVYIAAVIAVVQRSAVPDA